MFKVGDRVTRKANRRDCWPYGDRVVTVKYVHEYGNIEFEDLDVNRWAAEFFDLVVTVDEEIAALEVKLKTLRDKRDKEKFSEQLNAALKEMDEEFAPLATRGVATQYRVMGDDYTFVLTCSRT